MTGLVARHRPNHPNDDFTQPGILFRQVFNDPPRLAAIKNTSDNMRGVRRDIQ